MPGRYGPAGANKATARVKLLRYLEENPGSLLRDTMEATGVSYTTIKNARIDGFIQGSGHLLVTTYGADWLRKNSVLGR
jgi:hypothetical protein